MSHVEKSNSRVMELHRPFTHNGGCAWLADIDVEGDSSDMSQYFSDLQLFENGAPLGPERSSHGVIREQGRGRFSHWQRNIFFASSDNTDPNINGRIYTARVTRRELA